MPKSSDQSDEASAPLPGPEILARAAEAAKRAVRAGDFAPTFRLQDLHGGTAALVNLISKGPLVISFYRGIWCTFCDVALDALSRIDDDIRALGARQIAIGPPPATDDQRQKLDRFRMPILVDRDLRICQAYGLAITLPDALQRDYIKAGYTAAATPEHDGWQIPIPATYIVGQGGRVALAAIDSDYRHRLDPGQLLAVLRGVRQRTLSAG